jgi:hypothetical protein
MQQNTLSNTIDLWSVYTATFGVLDSRQKDLELLFNQQSRPGILHPVAQPSLNVRQFIIR